MYETTLSVSLGLTLLFVTGALVTSWVGVTQRTIGPAAVAYCTHATTGILLFSTVGLFDDAVFYHVAAVDVSHELRSGEPPTAPIGSTKASFIWILGGLYFLIGSNPLLGLMLNALLMGLIPSLMALSCRNFGLGEASRAAAWVSALAPQFLFWAPWLRREALAFFLITVTILAMSLLFNHRFGLGLTLYLALIPALAVTRAQLLAVAIVGGIAATLASHTSRPKAKERVGLLVGGLVLCVIVLLQSVPLSYFLWVFRKGTVATVLSDTAAAGQNLAAPGVNAEFNTSIFGFTINLVRVIAGPLPWEWKNLAWLVVGLDGILFASTFALGIWIVTRIAPYRRQVLVLLVAIVPLLIATTLVFGNYGIVMRVRAHFLPFLIPLLAITYDHMRKSRNRTQLVVLKSQKVRGRVDQPTETHPGGGSANLTAHPLLR